MGGFFLLYVTAQEYTQSRQYWGCLVRRRGGHRLPERLLDSGPNYLGEEIDKRLDSGDRNVGLCLRGRVHDRPMVVGRRGQHLPYNDPTLCSTGLPMDCQHWARPELLRDPLTAPNQSNPHLSPYRQFPRHTKIESNVRYLASKSMMPWHRRTG